MRLKGKCAVVTAAAAGIGRASALAFAREGADVWATDIDEAGLKSLAAEEPGIRTACLDVRDEAAVARFFAARERTDVLFNVAGMVPGGSILDSDLATFSLAWDLNVLSMVRMIRAALPDMLARGHGAIVNMSSVASSITGVPNRCVYGTTKAAVIGLTKSVAVEFVGRGVRCNAICPGTVDTPSLRARIASQADPEEALSQFLARQPMKRFGKAQEIAALAVYLAGDEAGFVTGQEFVIDGGWTA